MLPDPDSLRCFLVAANHLNFRAAAAQVHRSPTAFSDRIQRLEAELGVVLFERTTRRVVLTAAGERLLGPARRALAASAAAAEAARAEGPIPFRLVLGTRYELGLSWLVPALGALEAERPERTLDLYFGDGPELLGRIRAGRVDAAVLSLRLTDADLAYAVLHPEAYVPVAAPALLARSPLTCAADARTHTLIDAHPDRPLFRYLLDVRPPAEAWQWGAERSLGTIAAIRARVLGGFGVAVLPRYFVEADLAAGRLVPWVAEPPPREDVFRLVWRRGHPREAELVLLAETLRAQPLQ
ncbi:MAG: LysR family transcriptional regulator [Myxococcales bacterium]|nr:LysR family transcriptional regulator [Myxococcales bacterium]